MLRDGSNQACLGEIKEIRVYDSAAHWFWIMVMMNIPYVSIEDVMTKNGQLPISVNPSYSLPPFTVLLSSPATMS